MNLDELDAERKREVLQRWILTAAKPEDDDPGIEVAEWVERCRHPEKCIRPQCGDFCFEPSTTLREKPDLSTEVLRETPDLSTSALIKAQAITGRQLMARLSAGEAFINAPTRVCDETDVVCSRGCGAGPCKAKK